MSVIEIKQMSDAEIVASYIMYLVSGAMNQKIRNCVKLNDEDNARKDRLSAALGNLPVFIGTTYRKIRLFDESWVENFAEWHEVGSVVLYDEFLSSTKSFEFANEFNVNESSQDDSYMNEFEVILTIKSRKGRTYSALFPDAEDDEGEVLFDCGSSFRVMAVSKDGRKIELEEEGWE